MEYLVGVIGVYAIYRYFSLRKGKIYIHRHGYRLDFHDKKYGLNEWHDSPRYKENPTDPPLYDPNEAKITGHAKHIDNSVQWIYTSPMTRCIQTSIILRRKINELRSTITGARPIQIRVVYDLAENGAIIDDRLSPSALAAKYPSLLFDSAPILYPIVVNESLIDMASKFRAILDTLLSRNEEALIMGHCGHVYLGITYLVGAVPYLYQNICGNEKTGILAICDNGKYKLIE